MSAYTIKLPESLKHNTLNRFIKQYSEEVQPDGMNTITFDFRWCKYISPAGAVALVSLKDALNEAGIETYAKCGPKSKLGQFLTLFNVAKVSSLEDAFIKKMSNYTVELQKCMNYDHCFEVHKDIMEKIVKRTGCVDSTKCAIHYMLSEIWDNAGVHGYKCYETSRYPKPIYFCAFSYKESIEVAILDRGQGIHNSLIQNPAYRELNTKTALLESVRNNVSGHPTGSPGFGLYSAVEMISGNMGSLRIWSSGRLLVSEQSRIDIQRGYLPVGTLVVLKINANLDSPYEQTITSRTLDEELELISEL